MVLLEILFFGPEAPPKMSEKLISELTIKKKKNITNTVNLLYLFGGASGVLWGHAGSSLFPSPKDKATLGIWKHHCPKPSSLGVSDPLKGVS